MLIFSMQQHADDPLTLITLFPHRHLLLLSPSVLQVAPMSISLDDANC
jgi:hypothetical protein